MTPSTYQLIPVTVTWLPAPPPGGTHEPPPPYSEFAPLPPPYPPPPPPYVLQGLPPPWQPASQTFFAPQTFALPMPPPRPAPNAWAVERFRQGHMRISRLLRITTHHINRSGHNGQTALACLAAVRSCRHPDTGQPLRPDRIAYQAALNCCARSGGVQEAIELIGWMRHEGIAPQGADYRLAMRACARAGLPDEAWNFYCQLMQQRRDLQMVVGPSVFATAVASCGREQENRIFDDAVEAYAFHRSLGYNPFENCIDLRRDALFLPHMGNQDNHDLEPAMIAALLLRLVHHGHYNPQTTFVCNQPLGEATHRALSETMTELGQAGLLR